MTARVPLTEHGRAITYKRGCRCDECRAYNIAALRAWRQRVNYRGCIDREWNLAHPDEVAIERLLAGADWRAIDATRPERIAAAEALWAKWGPVRAMHKANGVPDQELPGEGIERIGRRFGLRPRRDFAMRDELCELLAARMGGAA